MKPFISILFAALITLQATPVIAADSCPECKNKESQVKKLEDALRVQKEYLDKNKEFLDKSKNNKKTKDSSYVVRAYAQATEIKIKIEKLTLDLEEAHKELEKCTAQCKKPPQSH